MKIKDKSNLYQWDINQTFTCVGGKYVDFPINKEVFRVEVVNDECRIPDEFLQTYGVKSVYVCYADGTYRREEFKVNSRPVPPNYIFTPTEQETFDSLVDKVNATVEDLETRAARGDFNGRDGKDGKDGINGVDGYSPIAKVERTTNGAKITITDKNGTTETEVYDGQGGSGGDVTKAYVDAQDNAIRNSIPTKTSQLINDSDFATKSDIPTPYDDTEIRGEVTDVKQAIQKIPQDIQINGTSIVEGGIANIPYSSQTNGGVVKVHSYYGIGINNDGEMYSRVLSSQQYSNLSSSGFVSKGTLEMRLSEVVGTLDTLIGSGVIE